MQIVIDIDEKTYNDLKKGKIYTSVRDVPQESVDAIKNGTPLPKGHGGLIDVDDLIKRAKQYIDSPDKYISQRNKDFVYYLELEEVIIPADKAEEEEEEGDDRREQKGNRGDKRVIEKSPGRCNRRT